MRERDYQLQTPQKDHAAANRRPKLAADRSKKSHQPSQKNADGALGYAFPKDSIGSSSVVESLLDDSSEDSTGLMTPASSTTTSSFSRVEESAVSVQLQSAGSSALTEESCLTTPASSTITFEGIISSDVSPFKSTFSSDVSKSGTGSNSKVRTVKEEGATSSSVEMEVVLENLRTAQLQVSKAKGVDLHSKRILDALVDVFVEEITQFPEEKNWINEFMSKKGYLVLLLVILWSFAVFAFLFTSSRGKISFTGPVPT